MTEPWKNEKMVTAGKKAHITKLKNAGKIEEARRLEETMMGHIEVNVPKPQMDLKQLKVAYNVPYIRSESEDNLPWVERFRPVSLSTLTGDVAPYLRAFIKTNSFPLALVFYGDYGQGKTAAAKAFVRDYYVNAGIFRAEATFKDILNAQLWTEEFEGCWSPVLYVDATITSDVEMIREKVMFFMRVRSIWNPVGLKMKKFAIFDEADRLGYASQGALRSLLEKYPNTVTMYTTNKIESIDPAIVSRASGGVFEFRKPNTEMLMPYLQSILASQGKTLSENTIEEIVVASQSIREAVGKLQQEVAIMESD